MRPRSDVLSALTLLVLTATAVAQPSPEATRLFEDGRELAKQGKWAEACERFQKSVALDPAPGTKLNLGDCLEKQGKVRAGWIMFEEAARDFDRTKDARAKFAHDRAAAASAKLATLVIKVTDSSRAGLAIRINDRTATPQPEIVERVDPGPVTVSVTAPDKQPFTATETAAAGKTVVVDVPVLADPRSETISPDPVVGPDDTPGRRRKRMIVAIGLGAAGGLCLAGSAILGLSANSQYDGAFANGSCVTSPDGNLCTPEGKAEVDSAGTKADLGTGFLVAGVALVAAGVIVYVTAPEEHRISVSPMATSSSAGVMLGGTF
jgi:hypothetical protein